MFRHVKPAIVTSVLLVSGAILTAQHPEWPQFGGPARNFHATSADLARGWPKDGPPQVWSRALGEGFSGIAVAGDTLFTMFRRGDDEVIIALDATTGHTRWEQAAPAGAIEQQDLSQGPGPHVTPLLTRDLVCAIGVTARMRCLDQRTGEVRWTHDLVQEFGATPVFRGYSSSPVAFEDLIVVQAGGKTHALIAFDAATGRVRWHGGSHANNNSSPVIVPDAPGGPQAVAFFATLVAGYDLRTGAELWTHPHPQRFNDSIAPPLVVATDVVVSSALDGGTRRLGLGRGDQAESRQRWHQTRLAVYYTNLAAGQDMILGSSGGLGPTFFTALDARTGDVLWQTRDIKRSNFVVAGSLLVMRDEDGALVLAEPSRTGVRELARATLFAEGAPSPPTLVGTTLYARDRQRIAAFDLKK